MNGKRRAMTQKNELMNEKFNELTIENKLKLLNLNEDIQHDHRYKYMALEDIVFQIWFNKTNAEKRQLVKSFN